MSVVSLGTQREGTGTDHSDEGIMWIIPIVSIVAYEFGYEKWSIKM